MFISPINKSIYSPIYMAHAKYEYTNTKHRLKNLTKLKTFTGIYRETGNKTL